MKEYIKINKKCYDKLANEYENRKKKYLVSDGQLVKPFIDYLKKHFDKIKVLELGPGSGLCLSFFEKEGFDTTAIDISEKMIKVSKKTASKTKYILENFLEYNFDEHKYDGILAKAFIHLFPKKDAAIALKKIFDLL